MNRGAVRKIIPCTGVALGYRTKAVLFTNARCGENLLFTTGIQSINHLIHTRQSYKHKINKAVHVV